MLKFLNSLKQIFSSVDISVGLTESDAIKVYCQEHDIDLENCEADPSAPTLNLQPGLERSALICLYIRFKRMAKEKRGAAFQQSSSGISAGRDMSDALTELQRALNNSGLSGNNLVEAVDAVLADLLVHYEKEYYDENGFGYGTINAIKRGFMKLVLDQTV